MSWLMGFGTRVEAVEPPELRETMHAASMAVAERYGDVFAGV